MSADTAAAVPPPAVDRDALCELWRELDHDCAALCRFVGGYLAMTDERLSRLEDAVLARDAGAVTVAALSMRTTSAMIGARGVAAAVQDLEVMLRAREGAEVQAHLRHVRDCTREASAALRQLLDAGGIPDG